MFYKSNFYRIALLLFVIAGCSNQNVKTDSSESISPDYARIICTIIEIDSTLQSTNPKDPCSKAPCLAKIKVDSLIGYGVTFGPPITKNKVLEVNFVYTTAKTTDEILQNFPKKYDGVLVGDKIQADIKSRSSRNSNELEYLIYGYSHIK